MTKREAKKKAHRHVADLIAATAPGDVFDEEWDDMDDDDQGRCSDALEDLVEAHRRQARS